MENTIIDVREPSEYTSGHIKGAFNIPLGQLRAGVSQLYGIQNDSNIIVYCRTGSRSQIAMNILLDMGYTNVKNGINIDYIKSNYS